MLAEITINTWNCTRTDIKHLYDEEDLENFLQNDINYRDIEKIKVSENVISLYHHDGTNYIRIYETSEDLDDFIWELHDNYYELNDLEHPENFMLDDLIQICDLIQEHLINGIYEYQVYEVFDVLHQYIKNEYKNKKPKKDLEEIYGDWYESE